ncbi:unnamed protein product [Closterium sp. NIES-64]|nr:unnamed protein product [Closterium sp. NIES-64]
MGKTLIAVMLMQARRQMRERSGKICVFLVPAVALVIQQAAVVEQQTDMRVGRYSTDTEIKYEASWVLKQVSRHEVLVMTPQVLVNLLQHAFLSLSSVDLLIFDECHHTAKDHAYATIMKTWYFSLRQSERPLIFGMTASPINTKGSGSEKSCVQQLLDFERILDSKVVSGGGATQRADHPLYTVLDRSCLVEVLPSAWTIQSLYDPPGEQQAQVLLQQLREVRPSVEVLSGGALHGVGQVMSGGGATQRADHPVLPFPLPPVFPSFCLPQLYTVLDRSCLVEVLPSAQTIQSHYDPPGEEQAQVLLQLLLQLLGRVKKERERIVLGSSVVLLVPSPVSPLLSSPALHSPGQVVSGGGATQRADHPVPLRPPWGGAGAGDAAAAGEGGAGERGDGAMDRGGGEGGAGGRGEGARAGEGREPRRSPKQSPAEVDSSVWGGAAEDGETSQALQALRAQAASGGMDQHEENARLRDAFAAVRLEFINRCEAFLRCGLPPKAKEPGPGGLEATLSLASHPSALLTPKIAHLLSLLRLYASQPSPTIVIFVERIVTAHSLSRLLRLLPSVAASLKADFVVGAGAAKIGISTNQGGTAKHSRPDSAISRFRAGKLNVLVATSAAEEGMDIPACHTVIRFDRILTVRSMLQSRGRARKPGAHFRVLVQRIIKREEGKAQQYECKYCFKVFSGAAIRCAQHLSSWKKMKRREVALYGKAPADVRLEIRKKYEAQAAAKEEKQRAVLAAIASVKASGKRARMTDYLEGDAAAAKSEAHEGLALMIAACRLPENLVEHPLFVNSMHLVARAGKGYLPPRRKYIGGAGLLACRKGIKNGLMGIKACWKKTGVTITSDMMTDKCGRPQANVLLVNDAGGVLKECVDCNMEKKTGGYIAGILKLVVEEVGPDNVVAFCMDRGSNYASACRKLIKMWPHIQQVPCATHVMDLMMEDVGKMGWAKKVVDHGGEMSSFTRNHHWTCGYLRDRKLVEGKVLQPLKPTGIRFGTQYIAISRLCQLRPTLTQMVVGDEWKVWAAGSRKEVAEKFAAQVLDTAWWKTAEFFTKLMQLPFKAMHMTDEEAKGMMGRIYDVMLQLTEDVEALVDADEEQLCISDKKQICRILKDRARKPGAHFRDLVERWVPVA